eukprot:m.121588 g.121588  ORF g.121588 m.121588 type:complete len:251 (+) comp52097_c0_seq6:128-880(+)
MGNAKSFGAIFEAAKQRNLAQLQQLMYDNQVEVDTLHRADKYGWTCTHFCMSVDFLDGARWLFDQGADPTIITSGIGIGGGYDVGGEFRNDQCKNNNLLHFTAYFGSVNCFMYLVEAMGFDTTVRNKHGLTALEIANSPVPHGWWFSDAAQRGRPQIVTYLQQLQQGQARPATFRPAQNRGPSARPGGSARPPARPGFLFFFFSISLYQPISSSDTFPLCLCCAIVVSQRANSLGAPGSWLSENAIQQAQ